MGKFNFANKGGIYMEIKVSGTEFGIINCHLESGEGSKKNQKRYESLSKFQKFLEE